jgi:hypothetical protein
MSYPDIYVKAKKFFLKTYSLLNKRSLYPWYVFSVLLCYFLVVYMTIDNVFSLDDHFFHIRFAELIREKGFSAFTDFQSIYFSKMGIVKEYFVYYNFLFYIALIPFTFVAPLVVGIKLYGIFVLTTMFFVVYMFLRKIGTKYPFMWTLLFLFALLQAGYLSRFTLARPFSLTPAILVVMLYCIHKKKYFFTGLISFLYFYWHTATFFFPFCLALGYFIFEQFYGKKPDWKKVAWPFFGMFGSVFLTYIIFPGVLPYLKGVIFPVFFDTSVTKSTGIAEGGEVYGRDLIPLASTFVIFFITLVTAGSYEILRYVQFKRGKQAIEDEPNMSIQPMRAMLFMASIAFFGATAASGRFLDYFVIFCLLYVAIALDDLAKFVEIKKGLFYKSFRYSILIVAVFLFANMSLNFYKSLSSSSSYLRAQGPAEWMNSNLPQNKIIFNVDWDSFPTLYYFTGDKFRYTTGLEPRFLYDLDHRLYWEWANIGDGLYCESSDCTDLTDKRQTMLAKGDTMKLWDKDEGNLIAQAILKDFKTDIIVVSNGRKDLLNVMDNSDRFKKEFPVSNDPTSAYYVYRIVNGQ